MKFNEDNVKKQNDVLICLMPLFWPDLPPLSLPFLKGYLKKHRISADIYDFNNFFYNKVSFDLKKEWHKSCHQKFEQELFTLLNTLCRKDFESMIETLLKYKIIGFTCYKSNFNFTLKIAEILKEKNNQLKIIMGGPEIAAQFFKHKKKISEIYGHLINLFVIGEGEKPLLNFISGETLKEKVVLFKEHEDFSIPDYEGLIFSSYPKQKIISLLFSRGCIKKCRFCSERLIYKKFRTVPVELLLKQIAEHQKNGVDTIVFHDSMLNSDLNSLEDLCEKMQCFLKGIKWEAQIAVRNDMGDQLLKKMKQSGCYHLFIGLESGCDRTLKNMNKGYTAAEAALFFKKLKENGLSFGVSIITGFPLETESDFEESLQFILDHKNLITKIEQVNPFVYYEGTPLSKKSDYLENPVSLKRTEKFIEKIKEAGIKYTKAFVCNLINK